MSVGQCCVALAIELYSLYLQRKQGAPAHKAVAANGTHERTSSPDSLAYDKPVKSGKKE